MSSLLLSLLWRFKGEIAIGALAAFALWKAYDAGRDAANARHDLAQAMTRIEMLNVIIKANDTALAAAEARITARNRKLATIENQVKDYEQQLARNGTDCALDDTDIERLRAIRRGKAP